VAGRTGDPYKPSQFMVAALTKQALPKWRALLVEMGYDVCTATNKIHQHVVLNS
jgi:hypothetical protein